ncbi:hypothetical protein GE09DRAFT_432173 [Coniochaeta sp. 2T2.1]|nr:hypothetical protein GE09DRAFT_432173 [Coniochaeta sp. 2T2.1]
MGIPVIIATAAACGSLVTTMKSSWELSRMIRQKHDQRQAEEDAVRVYRGLRRALYAGRMSEKEYDHWLEKFLVAETERNLAVLRKIRAHLRIIRENSEKHSRRQGNRGTETRKSSRQKARQNEDDRPQKFVRFDDRKTYYVPDPPQHQRYQDVEWPQSAGSIEYFPLKDPFSTKDKEEAETVRLARLQRRTSVSYQESEVPPQPQSRIDSRLRDYKGRGRSRRREPREGSLSDGGCSDVSYLEKLGYRSRR